MNVPAIRTLDAVGLGPGIQYAKKLGITTELRPELGLALGASCVTMGDLTGVYHVFSNYGVRIKRRFIRWMYLAGIWSRYSGATETKLQQDVSLVGGRDLDLAGRKQHLLLREEEVVLKGGGNQFREWPVILLIYFQQSV